MLMLVMATAVPSALGGFLVGRWAVAVIAPAVWALYVLGLTQHLWGYGVGDGWQYGLIVGVAAAAVGAATGVHIRRVAYRRRDETLREGVS